ncbi:GTPase-associated protein 1-related protein [Amycolatopsis sp. NPDC101161]|uniref:GTPase-associated protein 1-related protein n=1 Tax=Amycolatopsis sp. NPDC101161 TaxID=3363940 RepID=UPI0038061398
MSAAFGQLYYTSCENGLAGYPGFQFNASTPGLRPDVLADVEALAGYEPPRELAAEAGVARLDRYPVNLCYRPGPQTLLANTVFVGNDYSHRFGNYFAHALVSEDAEASLGDLLPIELWRAPFWTSSAVPDPALPELPAPPQRGRLDRAGVDKFVRSHPCWERLPDLLTAVDAAVRGGERKVVLVEHDADAVAQWIAAVSYLLPEDLVRLMSFATYLHQPQYSRLDVIGTVPGSDVDRSAFDSYLLFDMVAGRSSPIAPHRLAGLLTEIGLLDAPAVWDRAGPLADGTEQGLDDWHPVVAAAVMRPGFGEPADAAAVAPWLAGRAGRLGAHVVGDIGARVLAAAASCADAAGALRSLSEAARTAGADGLLRRIELDWADVVLRSALRGRREFDGDLELSTDEARTRARNTLAEELPRTSPENAVDALMWAARSGVEVGERTLRDTGYHVFGPLVLENRTDERSRSLLGAQPPLSWGAVDHLVTVARTDIGAVVAVLGSGIGDLLEAGKEHELVAAVAVADVRRGRLTPAEALREITPVEVDVAVLRLLWPSGGWTHGEALDVLGALRPEDCRAPIVLEWLTRSVTGPPVVGQEHLFDRLCGRLDETGLYHDLPAVVRDRIDTHATVRRLIDEMTGAGERSFGTLLDAVSRSYRSSGPQRREMIVRCLLGRIDELPNHQRAQVLVRLPDLRQTYLRIHGSAGRPGLLDLKNHVLVAWMIARMSGDRTSRPAFDEISQVVLELRDLLPRRDVRKVVTLIERADPTAAVWFAEQPRRTRTGFWPFRARTRRP